LTQFTEQTTENMPTPDFIVLTTTNNAKLLVWEVTESADELLRRLGKMEIYAEEYGKIVSEKRKREFLGVRVAMNALLEKDVIISYDDNRKPYVSDNSYQISISHSGKWIAVIAHPTRAVGIDIECPSDKIQKIYTRFLSKTEQEELSDGKDIRQLQLAWSAKEAMYKIIGKQAVDFATQLKLFPFEVKTEGEIAAQHVPTESVYKLSYIQTYAYNLVYCIA